MADDAVSIDGTDYLPVGKPNSYKDYELIYYINDVTIENEEVFVEYGAAQVSQSETASFAPQNFGTCYQYL